MCLTLTWGYTADTNLDTYACVHSIDVCLNSPFSAVTDSTVQAGTISLLLCPLLLTILPCVSLIFAPCSAKQGRVTLCQLLTAVQKQISNNPNKRMPVVVLPDGVGKAGTRCCLSHYRYDFLAAGHVGKVTYIKFHPLCVLLQSHCDRLVAHLLVHKVFVPQFSNTTCYLVLGEVNADALGVTLNIAMDIDIHVASEQTELPGGDEAAASLQESPPAGNAVQSSPCDGSWPWMLFCC